MPLVVYCLHRSPIFHFWHFLLREPDLLWSGGFKCTSNCQSQLPLALLFDTCWGLYLFKMKMRSAMGTTLKFQTLTNPLGWVHCCVVCTNHSGQCTVNTDRSTVPEQCLLFWSGGRLAGGRRLPNSTFTRERDGSSCGVFMSWCVCVHAYPLFGWMQGLNTYFSNIVIKSSKNILNHLSFETGFMLQRFN